MPNYYGVIKEGNHSLPLVKGQPTTSSADKWTKKYRYQLIWIIIITQCKDEWLRKHEDNNGTKNILLIIIRPLGWIKNILETSSNTMSFLWGGKLVSRVYNVSWQLPMATYQVVAHILTSHLTIQLKPLAYQGQGWVTASPPFKPFY